LEPGTRPQGELNLNSGRVLQSGLFVALCCALAISGWSLFWVGRRYGMPVPIAALVSAGFDGAALAAAGYSILYVARGLRAWFPRVIVLIEAGASAFLNAQHPLLNGDPRPAIALYGILPVTVVVLLEIHLHMLLGVRKQESRGISRNPARWKLISLKSVIRRPTPRSSEGEAKGVSAGKRQKQIVAAAGASSGGKAVSSVKPKPAEVRAWARAQGMNMPPTGPVPKDVVQQYAAAHNGSSNHAAP
jgi:hypothetical protein